MGIIERALCKICNKRKPRRYCPGVNGDICSICCGTEREVTVHCPFECPYLQEARRHEEPPIADTSTFPNQDIRVSERFLRDNEQLLMLVSVTLLKASLDTSGAVDNDVKEALDALVRTYRTLESGLYYESRPSNPIAASIQGSVQEELQKLRQEIAEKSGMHQIRDADVLGVFAFLQRMEIQQNNGRRLGRAFLDFLRVHFPLQDEPGPAQSLITT
jgi:hypothetical protein